jgi:predicted helicase
MTAGENLGVSTTRSIEIGRGWEHVFCSRHMIQHHTVSLKEVNYLFPLYLYPDGDFPETLFDYGNERRPNLAAEFVATIANRMGFRFIADGKGDLKKTFGPEDIFHYMYAVFHSPTYRRRYAEFLKRDFPRVPLTSNLPLFRRLCALGDELVALHLMKKPPPRLTQFSAPGNDTIEDVSYAGGRVRINKTQYFENVPAEVWEFHIGGYQVCEKWLKDRKGCKLDYTELTYYQDIVGALSETIRVMNEIDQAIPKWPIE